MIPSAKTFLAGLSCLTVAGGAVAQSYDFAAAARYSEAGNGHALLVMQGGRLVFERYANGWSAARQHRLASGTKSFSGVLAAFAVQDGLLKLDERIADTITEWKSDSRKSRITYRQLLSLVSGIRGGANGVVPRYADAIKQTTFANPGTRFSYGPYPFQIFGEAMKRKLAPSRRSVADYMKQRILDPLGMKVPRWVNFNLGEPNLPSGVSMPAREWIKFGEFVLRGGVWNNKRLLDAKLLAEIFHRTPVQRAYGMTWWKPLASSSGPKDLVAAMGAGKQRLYVIPSHDMVVLRYGESTGSQYGENRFFEALMPAAFEKFGAGCRGSAGVPALGASSVPRLGGSLDLALTNLPAATAGAIYIGASDELLGPLPLPLDLGPIGMTGCKLLVSIDLMQTWSGTGSVTRRFPLPNDKALSTLTFFVQSAVLDRRANSFGMTTTNGGAARIGVR